MRHSPLRTLAITLIAAGLPLPVAIAGLGVQHPHDYRTEVLSEKGRQLAGVRVIAAIFDPNGINYLDSATSDGAGMAKTGDCEVVIAVSANGNIAVSRNPQEVRFGPTGVVRLKLITPSGRGLGNKLVTLAPEKQSEVFSTVGSLIPTDYVSKPPDVLAPLLTHKTDRDGNVEFRGVPFGVPFEVITPISKGSSLRFGSVKAGSSQPVIVTHDSEITGHVRNSKGRPVKGVDVELGVISYIVGDLDGAMPVYFRCRTDARGFYRITHVPNCSLQVQLRKRSDDMPNVRFVNDEAVKDRQWVFLNVKPGRNRFELRI